MRTQRFFAAATLLTLLAPVAAAAQSTTFTGQVRSRYELRDPVGDGTDEFTSMRVRAAMKAALADNLTVFIQFQDVRLWGEETSTLADFSADHLDLHQGYVRYTGQKLDWLTATVGRQETNFGGQRLVGAVGWTQQGRSFDGVRLDLTPAWGNVALIAYTLGDATAPAIASDSEFYGAYATIPEVGTGNLDAYWLFDRGEGALETRQSTVGARYAFGGRLSGRFEGTFQTGTRAGADVSAFMFGGRLGTTFADGKAGATLWYDYLSGDDPATAEVESFHTLYATNHKYYGFADLFLNVPVHTAGHGLQDLAVKLHWLPTDGVRFAADLHSFSAADDTGLAESHFANEVDLTLSHRYTPNLTLTAGYSYVQQDDGIAAVRGLQKDMHWFYLMLDAVIR